MMDIVGKRFWFYLVSFIVLLPGAVSLAFPPHLEAGIDFSSGSTFTVRFQDPVSQDQLDQAMDDLNHPEARVQSTGQNEFLVRTKELRGAASAPPVGPAPASEKDDLETALQERFGPLLDGNGEVTENFIEFSSISASLSREIARNAAIAVVVASFAIFMFLWYAFRSVPQPFRFGTAAVLALLHDVLLVLGVFSILGRTVGTEVNSFFITALLTVIGFSVHDSIVVFDRIRETVSRGGGHSFSEAVNISLMQTLGRSINTSLTLIFSILALLLMGGESIRDFLLAMLVGTATGVYSSVFIASQILVSWDEGDVPRLWRRLFGGRGRERMSNEEAEAMGAEA